MTREQPPEAQEGFHWEPVEAPPEWRVATELEVRYKHCRNSPRKKCTNDVAFALNRGYHRRAGGRLDAWWFYCAEHAYGRWVEAGKVMEWRLGKDDEVAS